VLAERAPLYAEVAATRIATDGLSAARVAEQVLETLGRAAGAPPS
jgi:shikimate kinase